MGRLMGGCLLLRNEGRYDFSWHSDRPPERLVDNRPLSSCANANFPVSAGELDEAIGPGALRLVANEGSGSDQIAHVSRAQIIDLMPHHDPMIGLLQIFPSDCFPMRDRHLLDPLHPDRIVDMAELVDVLGSGSQTHFEDRNRHPSVSVKMNA